MKKLQTDEQIALVAKLLQIPLEKAKEHSGLIKDIDALYFSEPVKGGQSLIVGQDGTVLYVNSSVGYTQHLQEYKNGRRTPLQEFEVFKK
jgi:hypothetical protein